MIADFDCPSNSQVLSRAHGNSNYSVLLSGYGIALLMNAAWSTFIFFRPSMGR